jgi:hypothetical protein
VNIREGFPFERVSEEIMTSQKLSEDTLKMEDIAVSGKSKCSVSTMLAQISEMTKNYRDNINFTIKTNFDDHKEAHQNKPIVRKGTKLTVGSNLKTHNINYLQLKDNRHDEDHGIKLNIVEKGILKDLISNKLQQMKAI